MRQKTISLNTQHKEYNENFINDDHDWVNIDTPMRADAFKMSPNDKKEIIAKCSRCIVKHQQAPPKRALQMS